jgi:hypothetical protein
VTPFKLGDVIQWDRSPDDWWGPITEIDGDFITIRGQGRRKGAGGFIFGSDKISLKYEDEPVIEEDWS